MKILHTADWHLGQTFYDNDRTPEHLAFLNWLFKTIKEEEIDAVLVSGDVYDNANPSHKAIAVLYEFIQKIQTELPQLQLIFTGGNHDSALRLEQPLPLLQKSNIKIIGSSKMDADKRIRFEDVVVRLNNPDGKDVLCLAVPFLRLGDYPLSEKGTFEYVDGVRNYYQQAYEFAKSLATNNEPILAMGHLHARGVKVEDRESAERDIIGGVEMISGSDFPKDLVYVALGHIHKAQKVGDQEHIRYCGSPIPLSFAEKNYKHQVIILTINDGLERIESKEIPILIPLLTVPSQPKPFAEVLTALDALELELKNAETPPYVEVLVDVTQMEANYAEMIKQRFDSINAKLVKITSAKQVILEENQSELLTFEYLDQVKPIEFLDRILLSKVPEVKPSLQEKLHRVIKEIEQKKAN